MKSKLNSISLAALSAVLLFSLPLVASAQTLINGANQTGIITNNEVDSYTFTANVGDSINLRLGTTGFYGYLRLYGPNGALLESSGGTEYDHLIAYTATNSGTFTALVSSWSSGDTGTYALHLAQMPESFIVPAGEQGGPLTNGADATGTITVGDQQMWSFTANAGDNINLRLGASFYDWLELYGPNGALLESSGGTEYDHLIAYTATNSGTFTALVSSWSSGDTGTYALHLAQMPESFIVPAGEQGGPLTNGADATGTITVGDQQMWSFTANAGDNINLRLGASFYDWLELYGPNGALLESSGGTEYDHLIAYTATNSGTFTALVSSWSSGDTGTYALHLAQMPESFIVPAGEQGGPLTNGADATGTITVGDQQMWSFTANAGDNINLRLGASFYDWLELYGPNGALLESSGGTEYDHLIAYTATNSGTFTALVSSWSSGDTGTYALHLAQMPESFIVPAGEQGGPLTNGADATGTITVGDQQMWSFTANAGDNINLRLGASFYDWLELYGPNGALLESSGGTEYDHLIAYTATNSGTFTALVSSWSSGDTGTYALHLAQMPESFIVPAGEQGGPMTGGADYAGTITLGDMDIWAFTACTGDAINLRLGATGFYSWLELYGPNGALLKSAGGTEYDQVIAYTATNCGTFTVLVSSWGNGGTGTYGLTANGLVYELRECLPKISGANFTFNEVGGNTNANASFVLYSTTNVATPFGLWTPVLTNQFDQFGVFGYTNIYNPAQRQQFFHFVVP